jgi:predicted ATPase
VSSSSTRRDRRRFGPGPYLHGLRRDPGRWQEGFPFDVPAVADVESLRLDAPVTLIAGDNGSGKSTLVEAIAEAIGFAAEGLYILDEPEAALSVSGTLALLAIVLRAAGDGAQFVIATHSPILLAVPDAHVYELGPHGVVSCAYDDLDAVRLTRGFLAAPERYLRAALE